MRHRTSLLSTAFVLGLLAVSAGAAQAQVDTSKPKMDAKTLQKQCLALAQRDSARDNSSMAAPAPAITDSLRTLCDSVNAKNPDFKKDMDKARPNHDNMSRPTPDSTTTVPANPTPPSASTTSASEPLPPSPSSTAAPKTETPGGSNPQ
jgi:hypothetical protein